MKNLKKKFLETAMEILEQQDIIGLIQDKLRQGKIVAIKGIGGYLLLADATNANTIKTLRERKHRPFKPFALISPHLKTQQ